ncbi:viroplasmin family protein [Clostridioides difficile]|uniref:ribonuclease H1 domain-containing protein n=1 Tax=Clostridioides difficile TaxID=1496 RepID=UPI00117AA0E0|nr:hypothetical protein [Clostridioides difficile]EGT3953671.1 hypothetical protein [Clostridioides difficile]MDN9299459.1 type II toxin-antitoxin system RnlA family toxin [Clostridioides difficile]HAT4770140.1 hypothetical protein [Clostridioides difficile]HAT4799190.1 hypothetical protein [Clostridioides difficile]
MAKKFYAVKIGRIPGVYETWDECKTQIDGYSGAIYKKFNSSEEARLFLGSEINYDKYDIKREKTGVVAYIDGSYDDSIKEYSYGMVILYDGKEEHYSEKFNDLLLVDMRNVAGEIKGAEKAMQYCIEKNIKSIELHYDYEGIEKWCTGEWKAKKVGTKTYQEYYNKIKDNLDINFIKVKSHSGDRYNDLADSLAKNALGIGSCKKENSNIVEIDKPKKGVYIDRDIIKTAINDIGIELWGDIEVGDIELIGNNYKIEFNVLGKKALLNLYFNSDFTTTITPSGKNKDYSITMKTLLEERYAHINERHAKTQVFKLGEEWSSKLINFISKLDNVEKCHTKHENPRYDCYKFKSKIGDRITFNVYENGTLTIQGKPAYLYGETMSFLSFCKDVTDEQIIKTTNNIHNIETSVDDARDMLKSVMPNTYGVINSTIFKILYPAIALRSVDKEMDDYSVYAFPALRALEAYIKYLFDLKNITVGNNFYKIFSGNVLCNEIKAIINNDVWEKALEKLYHYFAGHRHILFHVDQILISTTLLESKQEADDIVNEVVNLIETTYNDINN